VWGSGGVGTLITLMQDETARYVAQDNNKQAGRREIEKRRGAFNNNNVLYTIAIGGLSSRFFFCRILLLISNLENPTAGRTLFCFGSFLESVFFSRFSETTKMGKKLKKRGRLFFSFLCCTRYTPKS